MPVMYFTMDRKAIGFYRSHPESGKEYSVNPVDPVKISSIKKKPYHLERKAK